MDLNSKLIPKRYEEKVCLVTGATMGIGYAIARRLGLEGATVIICSRKGENVKKAEKDLKAEGVKCEGFVCNTNDKTSRAKLFESIKDKYNKLDVLVCNVAVNPYFGPAMDIGEREFDKIFEVNVKNTFFTIKDAMPLLKTTKNSNVLIISSTAGYIPVNYLGVYSLSKTTLLAMTKLLGNELAQFNIRVNCIAPGIIRSKFSKQIVDSDEAKTNYLKRVGVPDEISGGAAFICSEEASFVTGETLIISGGTQARL
jgi:dehydrogenase/reductase SDR family protein 4